MVRLSRGVEGHNSVQACNFADLITFELVGRDLLFVVFLAMRNVFS